MTTTLIIGGIALVIVLAAVFMIMGKKTKTEDSSQVAAGTQPAEPVITDSSQQPEQMSQPEDSSSEPADQELPPEEKTM